LKTAKGKPLLKMYFLPWLFCRSTPHTAGDTFMSQYVYRYDEKAGMDIVEHRDHKTGISVRRLGGELISYRIWDEKKKKVIPLMYRDGKWEPEENCWKNHATIIFPMVGGLKNKTSFFRGKAKITSRGNHGFARHSVFTLVNKKLMANSASLHYLLEPNEEIREYYPFPFKLELIYTIKGNDLVLDMVVTNGDKNREMPFSFGWHPGFNVPLGSQGKKTDCQLLLPAGKYVHFKCNEHSRLTGERETLEVSGPLAWTEESLHHTVMLWFEKKPTRRVTLFDPGANLKLHLDFADFPYLGLWANKGEKFICMEPWQGLDDHEQQEPFEDKAGMVLLKPGAVDRRKATVSPEF
jgi:galactose mutarotase-like enzyme